MSDFSIQKRIYYHDTDCGGVVYYANYLKHLEEARSEFFLNRGIELKELSDRGNWFVVAGVEIEYKAVARYHDLITVTVHIDKIKNASIEFYQEIKKGTLVLVETRTTLVFVGKDLKPTAIPEEIRSALS